MDPPPPPLLREKSGLLPQPVYATPLQTRRTWRLKMLHAARRATVVAGVVVVVVWLLVGLRTGFTGSYLRTADTTETAETRTAETGLGTGREFQWEDITPTNDLHWHPCFPGGFVGLRLRLLRCPHTNHTASTNTSTHAPLPNAATHPPHPHPAPANRPLLLNPGGPGGSGVAWILTHGPALHKIVGTQHTLISFDPRGVNNTTPATSCHASAGARQLWHARAGSFIPTPATTRARARSLGAQCEHRGQGAWVGTPNVARDMLALHEAALAPGEADTGLRYWGLSYGTALGMTFAAMYPARVGRVLLDGVIDLDDYYTGGWRRNLQDADAVVARFFAFCAGAEGCAFRRPGDTPESVEARLMKLLARLEVEPMPVGEGVGGADWVTAADVRTLLFAALYNPLPRFPLLARALHDLDAAHNATLAASLLHNDLLRPVAADDAQPNTGEEADSAVVCGDGYPASTPSSGGMTNASSLADYLSLTAELESQSRWIGRSWARIQGACTGWRTPPRGLRFAGLPRESRVETKGRVLFVNNELDPVTPVRNAVRMRGRFDKASLVVVKGGVGHGVGAVVSRCVAGVIGGFFGGEEGGEGGIGQGEEVECGVESSPFEEGGAVGMFGLGLGQGGKEEAREKEEEGWGWSVHVPGF
ncbi:hypothetical protein EDC01DRAFT_782659 [Geopyxis carbonaria]|nr:hypothetical protein EDC01DRAFT_782659 [Geopyxis carbonaria]